MEEGKPITIKIDGREVHTTDGAILLDVCREQGIDIPTLCHHESVSPAGACRLCSVEARYKDWSKVVVSCIYPVWDGLEVLTRSDRTIAVRKLVLETLLARGPNVKVVRDLAREYGIEEPRFPVEDHECILCSLCVRTCDEVVGVHALSMQGRGKDKVVGLPYLSDVSTCIGCGACVYVCPTQCIKLVDEGGVRRMWHEDGGGKRSSEREFELKYCKVCGDKIGPKKQLDHFIESVGLPENFYDICKGCRATGHTP